MPGLERELADHGVRAFCVDQTPVAGFDHLTPVATDAGPVAVPIDWESVELVWNDERGYPAHGSYRNYWGRTVHDLKPWSNAGEPYDHDAALAARARARARLRRRGPPSGSRTAASSAARSTPSCSGTGGTRGSTGSPPCSRRRRHRACRLVTVSEGIELVEPVGAAARARRPGGTAKDFTTWDAPAVAELAFEARAAELRTVAAVAAHGAPHAALERAARELLAMQASDWAFMVTRDLAADYPAERMRLHGAVPRRCACRSDRLSGRSGPVTARPGARPRPLSAHDSLARMRALILSWEYPPLIEGGLARHVRKLAENLAAQGVDVHVLARGREEDPAEEVKGGVLVHRVREPERPRDLSEFVAWIEHMNSDMLAAGVEVGDRYDFDVVHGHDWLVASAGDHLAKRFRAPLVVTIHATEYGRHQGWVDKHPQSYIHGVERWMANRAERVITCSSYMREHVADIYGLEESRVHVIPNGIDPSELVPVDDLDTLRSRFAAPDEKLVLLVGRLVYEKGFQLALEALPGLIERIGKVRFIVAGSGTAEQELREQATALGLDDHGTFLGWIGDDVLHSLYRIADLTVVPSIYEPFGLVALEAMASGCPCLVADTGGLREVVPNEDVGLRFRSRDPRSLATMAERLLTDDELRDRLVAEASEHVLSFDWADVAAQVSAVYRDVTRRSSDRAARRPLLIAPSISAANSPAVCSPANASGPVGCPACRRHLGRRRGRVGGAHPGVVGPGGQHGAGRVEVEVGAKTLERVEPAARARFHLERRRGRASSRRTR